MPMTKGIAVPRGKPRGKGIYDNEDREDNENRDEQKGGRPDVAETGEEPPD